MDEGLLLLRVVLAGILVAHSMQKSVGWFQGRGLAAMAVVFEGLGLRPGRRMVLMASTCELLAAASILLGLLTPLGCLAAVGTMTVAGLTMHLDAGKVWNAAGGGEYPYVLAAMAVVLAFTGPGAYAVDAVLLSAVPVLDGVLGPNPLVGVAVVVAAALAVVPFVRILRRGRVELEG